MKQLRLKHRIETILRVTICKHFGCRMDKKNQLCLICGGWQWWCYHKCDCGQVILPRISKDGYLCHVNCPLAND